MLWRQLLPEKSFGHRASNKKSNGKLDSGGVGWIDHLLGAQHAYDRAWHSTRQELLEIKRVCTDMYSILNLFESCMFGHF